MSISRRRFLLNTAGAAAGAIIPSFYFRALEYLEQHERPLLIAPSHVREDLVVADINDYPELCFGDPYAAPPSMTLREYLARYKPEILAEGRLEDWGYDHSKLDQMVHDETVQESWCMVDGPSARAYHYLKSLDLGPALKGSQAVGGLDFLHEGNRAGWKWLAVSPENDVTLSLLQQRLNDLNTGIRIVI